MGPTWPNLGPRCAPDSLTLLNIGPRSPTRTSFRHHQGPVYAPDSFTCARPSPTQTQVGRRPAVRRKPLIRPGAHGAPPWPCLCRRHLSSPKKRVESPLRRRPLCSGAFYSVFCFFHFSGFVAQDWSTWPNIALEMRAAPGCFVCVVGGCWANMSQHSPQDGPR